MAALVLAALAQESERSGPVGWEWGMYVVGLVFMLSIISLVVWVIWNGVRSQRARTERQGPPRAEEILGERYARGEISREEYTQRLADLRS